MDDQFINIELNKDTLDRYTVRTAIFKALSESMPKFKGQMLDAGCGKMPYKEFLLQNSNIKSYTGLDIEGALVYDNDIKPDLLWDGKTMPIADASFDTVMATEVLEHCPEPLVFLAEAYRALRPGGIFFFTVPFLWPLHEIPHDAYRYTPFTLERMFEKTGFSTIEIKSLGGYNAALATMMGLWLKRHLRDSWKKRLLTKLGLGCMRWLLKRDVPPTRWNESTMSTGFYGILVK